MSSLLHTKNLLLPEVCRASIPPDDVVNLREIGACLDEIVAESREMVDNRLLGRCVRLLNKRRTLKYILNGAILSRTVNVFHDLLMEKQLSFVMKTKLLVEMHTICSKKTMAEPLVLRPIAWQSMWKDIMDIAGRTKNDHLHASDSVINEYTKMQLTFLHASRRYFTMSDDEADALVQQAMDMLQDPRHLHCVDGLFLLLNCLPTKYHNYAHWLPQVTIREMGVPMVLHEPQPPVGHVLTRARKHTDIRAFSWQALMPLLTLKTRELLPLPDAASGMRFGHITFPFVFPNYHYFDNYYESAHTISLLKLSKLMYFAAMQDALLASSFNPVGMGNSSNGSGVCECVYVDPLTITPPSLSASEPFTPREYSATTTTVTANPLQSYPGYNEGAYVLSGVAETVAFFQSLRSFYYAAASDTGSVYLVYFTANFVSELSRHVGLSLGHQWLGPEAYSGTSAGGVNGGSKYFAFEAPMHLPSVRYLAGMLTLLSMEGLYGVNQSNCTTNLQNLCAVDPALGHIILPFLLRALDPAAVNQSHQAPIAIRTATAIFRPLLFPRPVILKYLPDLLKLLLPGVDPCDPAKTSVTLQLLSTIFSWLPLKSKYLIGALDASAVPSMPTRSKYSSYLSSVNTLSTANYSNMCSPSNGGSTQSTNGVGGNGNDGNDDEDSTQTSIHLETLSGMIGDWSLSLLDKVFQLLEAHDAPLQGVVKRIISMYGNVNGVVGYLLQAVDPVSEPLLWRSLEDKIMGYFSKSSPVNATKVSAKIVDALVNGNPACISRVLPLLLDSDVMSLNCSHDKLAFRLRLAGGALRSCQGAPDCLESLVLPLVLSVVGNPALVGHAEKPVRKATCKLAKDLLKGLTSFYPIGTRPLCHQGGGGSGNGNGSKGPPQIGAPNSLERPTSGWYTPTPSALTAGAKLLRATVLQPMQALVSLLTALSTNDSDTTATSSTTTDGNNGASTTNGNGKRPRPSAEEPAGPMTVKKAEEALVQGMKMLQKGLRGAAEVLGDEHNPGALVTLPATPSRTKLSRAGAIEDEHGNGASDGGGGGKNDDNKELLFQPMDPSDQDEEDRLNKDQCQVVSTGRDEVLQLLAASALPNAQADRELYLTLRFAVMDFLVFVEDALMDLAQGSRPAAAGTSAVADTITTGNTTNATMISVENKTATTATTAAITGAYVTVVAMDVVDDKTDAAAAAVATPGGRPYASLADSTSARAAWAKTLKILINSRTACKGAYLSGLRRPTGNRYSQLVGSMVMRCRMMTRAGSADTTASSSLDYWLGHDLTANDVANTGWQLHALRVGQFVPAAARRNVDKPTQTPGQGLAPGTLATASSSPPSSLSYKRPLLSHLLEVVIRMCGHEYDAIRAKAINTYTLLINLFGSTLSFELLNPLLTRITIVGTPYPVIAGALSLILTFCDLFMDRWHITEGFIRLIFTCPLAVAAIVEQDKRKILQEELASIFAYYYVDRWHHFALSPNEALSAGRLVQGLLASVGFDADSGRALEGGRVPLAHNPRASASATGSTDDTATAAVAMVNSMTVPSGQGLAQGPGLRQDTFTAFVIMHFIGHKDICMPLGALAWSLHTLYTAHGQPTQNVALTSFLRIVVGACKTVAPHTLMFTPTSEQLANGTNKPDNDSKNIAYISFLQQSLHPNANATTTDGCGDGASGSGCGSSGSVSWSSLLQGLSQAFPKAAEDGSSAQWSAGIDQVMNHAGAMRAVLPCRITHARTNGVEFSLYFRPEMAGLISSLAVLLTHPPHEAKSQGHATKIIVTPEEILGAAFAASKGLSFTTENEAIANTVVCAELFAGLLRGFTTHLHHQLQQELLLVQSPLPEGDEKSSTLTRIKTTLARVEQLCVDYFVERVDKLSESYFVHWAEAVHFVTSCGYFHASGPLCSLVMDGCKRVLAPKSSASALSKSKDSIPGSSSSTAMVAVSAEEEEGSVRQSRSLILARAALTGEIASCSITGLAGGVSTRDAPLGTALTQLLCEPDSNVLNPFCTCRTALGELFGRLAESYGSSTDGVRRAPDLTPVLLKLVNAAAAADIIKTTEPTSSSSATSTSVASTSEEGKNRGIASTTVSVSVTSHQKTPQQSAAKQAIEIACMWSRVLNNMNLMWSLASLPTGHPSNPEGVGALLGLVIRGTGHTEKEVAWYSQVTCYFHVYNAVSGGRGAALARSTPSSLSAPPNDPLSITLTALVKHRGHSSFHVRKTVVLAVTSFMLDNWSLLSEAERKSVKETFSEGLHDNKPEVQLVAVDGMAAYLAMQPLAKLRELAAVYVRNSDAFVRRFSKKRGATGDGLSIESTGKPERDHTTTVMMMACIIQALPYDLPSFLPSLITSFVRHVGVPSLKDTVTRTVQMFKRTHQDRWEMDFKHAFTRDQLENLQGVGSADYFN